MADQFPIPQAMIDQITDLLADFPADGRPQDHDATQMAVHLGFVERREISKACPGCGASRPDYTYYRVTLAGKLYLRAARPQCVVNEK